MSNLSKELIRQIIADGEFQTPKDIGDYLKDMFKDVIQEMLEKELALDRQLMPSIILYSIKSLPKFYFFEFNTIT